MSTYRQTTAESLDYSIDWTRPLTEDSDTIASDVWALIEGDVTLSSQATVGSVSLVTISGGTVATRSRVACTMTTTAGRIHQLGFWIEIIAAGRL